MNFTVMCSENHPHHDKQTFSSTSKLDQMPKGFERLTSQWPLIHCGTQPLVCIISFDELLSFGLPAIPCVMCGISPGDSLELLENLSNSHVVGSESWSSTETDSTDDDIVVMLTLNETDKTT
jgi:hypothetical protein